SAGPLTGPGPVSAAPYGSAGVLPISWTYLRLMGPDGLRSASEVAVLAANYLARRLAPHYPVLYTGRGGLVAHECLIDLRPLTGAPHTALAVAGDWAHPYSRDEAAYPLPALRQDKYWSPVGRIDGGYGDRNLMCSCPPLPES